MLESKIESAVGAEVLKNGGLFYKFTSPGRRGVPDRLVILPTCPAFFIEFKAPNKKPSILQQIEHTRIRARGVEVFVIDDIGKGIGLIQSKVL